jgi:hypothetical protein
VEHHLAQLNIALPKAPLEEPLLADFVAQLDSVNAKGTSGSCVAGGSGSST